MTNSKTSSKAKAGTGGCPKAQSDVSTPSSSALIICRNKHWRYISSFHGPWLQLPPEVLETLAHSNFHAPRPRPIDPAVLYDLVKIRRLVDDATNLAVRAASGIAASALSKDVSVLGGNVAGVLGLGGGGPAPRLSRERKHRMRELATQKLAKAYTLDEIAASVATMQSASSLEDVANLVLARNPEDPDAKYVHFFHEKIPSRMLAKCTSLKPLDDVLAERPSEGAVLRTRAVTKGFKEDFAGATQDLTNAISICRIRNAHDAGVRKNSNGGGGGGRRSSPGKTEEEDQPSSLETQLLFHRASTYLTIACQHIEATLLPKSSSASSNGDRPSSSSSTSTSASTEAEVASKRDKAKRAVRTNAKRALRDYLKFLSHFDYTPGLPAEAVEGILKLAHIADSQARKEDPCVQTNEPKSIPEELKDPLEILYPPSSPRPELLQHFHPVSSLFASPPPPLPPFPPTPFTTVSHSPSAAAAAFLESNECITYHPLLTDALHSLLLAHTILQTPPKELLRHAYTVARLARVCDGYPVFLTARSPARADWMEVLRKTGNWIGLEMGWEQLCSPVPLHAGCTQQCDAEAQMGIVISGGAGAGTGEKYGVTPKRWSQEDRREYPVCTERAGLLVKWVKEELRRDKTVTREREVGEAERDGREVDGVAARN